MVSPERDKQEQASYLADQLPRLVEMSRKVAQSFLTGHHVSGYVGDGDTFREYRDYQPGDQLNWIDWRRSAREDRPMVRLRERLAPHRLWFWLDASPSMKVRYPTSPMTKYDSGLVLLMALAEIICRAGDRVGIPGLMAPVCRRAIIDVIAERLADQQDKALDNSRFSERDEVFVFSDGLRWYKESLEEFSRSLAGVRVHFIHLADQQEIDFPFKDAVNFVDPKSGARLRSRSADDWRKDYLSRFHALEDERLACGQHNHWSMLTHRPDWPFLPTMMALHAQLSSGEGLNRSGWVA